MGRALDAFAGALLFNDLATFPTLQVELVVLSRQLLHGRPLAYFILDSLELTIGLEPRLRPQSSRR